MVKQFTVPCKFGQETAPVTLYIGHPDNAHHPIHFQSEWLSSTKGGVIPQDLMNTLQKLHDLAKENGADFEQLCYYALISATEHSIDGITPSEINKYANEFINNGENTNGFTSNNEKNNTENNSQQSNNQNENDYNKEDEDLLLNDNSDDNEILNENENSIENTNLTQEYKTQENNEYEDYSQEDEDLLLNDESDDNI